jgi:hypothetical protein
MSCSDRVLKETVQRHGRGSKNITNIYISYVSISMRISRRGFFSSKSIRPKKHHNCPVLAVLSWLSSHVCPSWQSSPGYLVSTILCWLSCPSVPVLVVRPGGHDVADPSWQSQPGSHVLAVFSWLSCPGCTFLVAPS